MRSSSIRSWACSIYTCIASEALQASFRLLTVSRSALNAKLHVIGACLSLTDISTSLLCSEQHAIVITKVVSDVAFELVRLRLVFRSVGAKAQSIRSQRYGGDGLQDWATDGPTSQYCP